MKKLLFVLFVAMVIVPVAMADPTITTYTTSFNGGLNGGEFSSVTSANGSFTTFCLEDAEFFYPGTTYNYQLSNAAIKGGTATSDPLSEGAAWLYLQFRSGALDPDYSSSHSANAGLLQQAIWMLEDEIGWDATNKYIVEVVAQFGSQAAAKANYSSNQVRVLNVYSVTNDHGLGYYDPDLNVYLRQDLLGVVPDGGLTVMLLGLGVGGLAFFSRKFRQ